MADAVAFSSVKLPAALVKEARETAIAFRRSTAGQIEYWAILGKAAEDAGLTAREAQAAIEAQAANARKSQVLDDMEARFAAADTSASLADKLRQVVLQNRANASAGTH